MAKSKAHPGFKGAARQVAKKQGISIERANKIIGKGKATASAAAKKKNPRLKRTAGYKKASEPTVSARGREQSRIQALREARGK